MSVKYCVAIDHAYQLQAMCFLLVHTVVVQYDM